MQHIMEFPNTFDEFAKEYGFTDTEQIYTNGSELIPIFRVKQWLEHIEPKTGHWIKREPYPTVGYDYECSECGNGNGNDYDAFCRNCGAKMIEPQERSDKE